MGPQGRPQPASLRTAIAGPLSGASKSNSTFETAIDLGVFADKAFRGEFWPGSAVIRF